MCASVQKERKKERKKERNFLKKNSEIPLKGHWEFSSNKKGGSIQHFLSNI